MQADRSALYLRLRPFAWRLRLRDTFGYAQRTAWFPGLGLVALQLAGHLLPIPHLNWWSWLPALVWLGGMCLLLIAWHQPPVNTARRVDQLLGLRERLSTALEHADDPSTEPIEALQRADAITFASRVRPKDLGWAFQRRTVAWLVLPLLLGSSLIMLPNPQQHVLAQQAAIAQSIGQTTKAIDTQQQALRNNKELSDAERKQLLAELQSLQKALQANPKSREEALARLSATEGSIQSRLDPQADARQAGLEQLAHQLEQAQNMGQPQAPQATQAAHALAQAAQNLDQMTPAQQQALRQTLEQQANANANSNQPLSQQLQHAADALTKGDKAAASQSLQQASQTAQQTSQGLANNQARQQTLSKLQESRQSVAQAGQGQQTAQQGQQQGQAQSHQGQGQAQQGQAQSQQGQGQNQQGQGNSQQGQGQGQGSQPVGQSGGSNANNLGNQSSNAAGKVQPNGKPGQGAGTGKNNTIYQPFTPSNQQGKQEQAAGQQGSAGQTQVSAGQYAPGQNNQALVPYQQVYNDYHNAAEQALDSSAIPPHLKGYVRDYFTQLNPGP